MTEDKQKSDMDKLIYDAFMKVHGDDEIAGRLHHLANVETDRIMEGLVGVGGIRQIVFESTLDKYWLVLLSRLAGEY